MSDQRTKVRIRSGDMKKEELKANRKGSREAELEDSTGWKAVHKVHRSKKTYTRKKKHKKEE